MKWHRLAEGWAEISSKFPETASQRGHSSSLSQPEGTTTATLAPPKGRQCCVFPEIVDFWMRASAAAVIFLISCFTGQICKACCFLKRTFLHFQTPHAHQHLASDSDTWFSSVTAGFSLFK